MVHRLRGMFAFAIWDEARRRLFLARDPYGIKPLYTANDGWTFRFASQVKALLAGGNVSRDPEPAGVVGFHLFGSVPEPFTLYRDVRSLPAGHTQWVDAAGPREPKPFANLAEVLAKGAAESSSRSRDSRASSRTACSIACARICWLTLRSAFFSLRASTRARCWAPCAMRANARSAPSRSLSKNSAARRRTRRRWPRTYRERYGAHHVVRHLSQQEFVDDLPAILDAMDQPSIDGVNTWFVSKAAKEAGLKVAISGLGGDELLGGYPSFVDVPRWRRRFGPFAACRGLVFLHGRSLVRVAPGFSRARPKALGLLEYSGSWAGAYFLRRGLFLPHELPDVMDREMAREGLRRLKPLRRLAASLCPIRDLIWREFACWSRRTTCAINFCGTPIGRAWRTAWRFACRSSTSSCWRALASSIPAITRAPARLRWPRRRHAVAERSRDSREVRLRSANGRLAERSCRRSVGHNRSEA